MIGQRFPTPSRATAAACLASQRQPTTSYRPGLSADISGTAYLDAASFSSALSSVGGTDQGTTGAAASRGVSARSQQRANNDG